MDWQRRFQQQSEWTKDIRRYLIDRNGLQHAARVLEAGCGTGAITRGLHESTNAEIYGLDFNLGHLQSAALHDPETRFCGGDARKMPFSSAIFDAVVCHFFLLWVPNPADALREMVRVARPGAAVIAFAEPDYGGRIDYPAPLEVLGKLQAGALRDQGADPQMGRKLSGLFQAAGLDEIETGVLGGQWRGAIAQAQIESEWAVLESDLAGKISIEELRKYQAIDRQAWQSGERVLFVPTFFAFGRKRG